MISSSIGSVALDENAVIQKIFVSVFNSNEIYSLLKMLNGVNNFMINSSVRHLFGNR